MSDVSLHLSSMDYHKANQFHFGVLLIIFYSFAVYAGEAQRLPTTDHVGDQGDNIKTYIVHVEKPEGAERLSNRELRQWHQSFLPNTTLDSAEPRLIYSYREAISGFAARLTAEEVRAMEVMDGFVYARPDSIWQLETTYTPQFLGISRVDGPWEAGNLGQGIVVGVLDSGIYYSHPSFSDKNMAPPPPKFQGSCDRRSGVQCNKKIVGAKGFKSGITSALDDNGHGTHVASTVAGNFVDDAEVLGMAPGQASGMAPLAHLSIYKVCFADGCNDSDILAAIDQAIRDKVDIITMSIGGKQVKRYTIDGIAHGSLSALRNNIAALAAAGNNGPSYNSLSNDAPWVLTVGATSTDRRIRAIVKLGNGLELAGESAYQPITFDSSVMLPIAFPGSNPSQPSSKYCVKNSLNWIDVSGKIVLCWVDRDINSVEQGQVVFQAGGAAMILINSEDFSYTTDATAHVLPASHLSYNDGMEVVNYFSSASPAATATIIFRDTVFGNRPSPAVASFSSRGPWQQNGGVIKPDVVAPGVNILAAWPVQVGPTQTSSPSPTFNFLSGTSMATPHVAGIVALIKKKHPDWSPSAIQSAIITSANDLDLDGNEIADEYRYQAANVFSRGAGQVNALRALDPGLVYEIDMNIYPCYLLSLGYSPKEVRALWGDVPDTCRPVQASALNYPSIEFDHGAGSQLQVTDVERTVKNVAKGVAEYLAHVTPPEGTTVHLSTYVLCFTGPDQTQSFTVGVDVAPNYTPTNKFSQGKLQWISAKHVVTSPIVVRWI